MRIILWTYRRKYHIGKILWWAPHRGELPDTEPNNRPCVCLREALNPRGKSVECYTYGATKRSHNIWGTSSLQEFTQGKLSHNEFYSEFLCQTMLCKRCLSDGTVVQGSWEGTELNKRNAIWDGEGAVCKLYTLSVTWIQELAEN